MPHCSPNQVATGVWGRGHGYRAAAGSNCLPCAGTVSMSWLLRIDSDKSRHSAPIVGETGDVVAAGSAAGPSARIIDERVAALSALVLETARAISAEMGAPRR